MAILKQEENATLFKSPEGIFKAGSIFDDDGANETHDNVVNGSTPDNVVNGSDNVVL